MHHGLLLAANIIGENLIRSGSGKAKDVSSDETRIQTGLFEDHRVDPIDSGYDLCTRTSWRRSRHIPWLGGVPNPKN